MSNKSEYGLTLAEARTIAKEKLGRLPRPGNEVLVKVRTITMQKTWPGWQGWTMIEMSQRVYLKNHAGRIALCAYVLPEGV